MSFSGRFFHSSLHYSLCVSRAGAGEDGAHRQGSQQLSKCLWRAAAHEHEGTRAQQALMSSEVMIKVSLTPCLELFWGARGSSASQREVRLLEGSDPALIAGSSRPAIQNARGRDCRAAGEKTDGSDARGKLISENGPWGDEAPGELSGALRPFPSLSCCPQLGQMFPVKPCLLPFQLRGRAFPQLGDRFSFTLSLLSRELCTKLSSSPEPRRHKLSFPKWKRSTGNVTETRREITPDTRPRPPSGWLTFSQKMEHPSLARPQKGFVPEMPSSPRARQGGCVWVF